VSDIDSLIRERLDAAAAFDVKTDPQRVREIVARRQRRIRRRRRTTVLLGALAAAGVAVGVVHIVDQGSGGDVAVRTTDVPERASDNAEASTESRPRFLPAPGWETVPGGSTATAANIPLGPNTLSGDAPWDTVERLEEGDILLYAMFWPAGKADLPPREFPLSLDDALTDINFEGQPDHIYADRLGARVNGWNIDLLIFYGGGDPTAVPPVRAQPSAETRAAAQEQLARLVVPDHPSRNGTTSSSPPTIMPAVTAEVTGRAGGPPPCDAASAEGRYGANVSHPERAPLIEESTFGDLRWAICGASPVFSDAILNLRSDDNGATWSVNDTGIGLMRFHAGDLVDITFIDATSAEMHVASPVAGRDERYETFDGGRTWQ
jgi:hypothetical protein